MNPIGVFDSGIGGLTVVRSILTHLPELSILYYGDTAHLPYGNKSPETIRNYVRNITEFLLTYEVSAIVIACNTASAVATDLVKQLAKDIPVFNVITPTCENAIQITKKKKIGIIGTITTIQSGIYKEILSQLDSSVQVVQKATPLLVPLIEDGWLGHPLADMVIEAYLTDHIFQDIDTLILGCTHYPLLKPQIQAFFKKHCYSIQIIESSESIAQLLENHFKKNLNDFKNMEASIRNSQFFVSDLNPHFENLARKLFPNLSIKFQEKFL